MDGDLGGVLLAGRAILNGGRQMSFVDFDAFFEPFSPVFGIGVHHKGLVSFGIDHFVTLIHPFEDATVKVKHGFEAQFLELFPDALAAVTHCAIDHHRFVAVQTRDIRFGEIFVVHKTCIGDVAHFIFAGRTGIEQDRGLVAVDVFCELRRFDRSDRAIVQRLQLGLKSLVGALGICHEGHAEQNEAEEEH